MRFNVDWQEVERYQEMFNKKFKECPLGYKELLSITAKGTNTEFKMTDYIKGLNSYKLTYKNTSTFVRVNFITPGGGGDNHVPIGTGGWYLGKDVTDITIYSPFDEPVIGEFTLWGKNE